MSFASRSLLLWAALHFLLWTIVPAVSFHCLPLDSVEAVMWGNTWQLGYDKHPPLSAWLAAATFNTVGASGIYALSALCVVLAGLGVYQIARLHHFSVERASLAALLLECIYYFQYGAVEFNVNVLQLPFWAWGWYYAARASRHGRMRDWLFFGLLLGLGALTKYLAVWLLIPLFCYWAERKELRGVLKSPGLYAAALVSILVFSPHFYWMTQHDYMTLTYGLRRAEGDHSFLLRHLWYPLEYLLSQLAIVLPVLLIFYLARRWETRSGRSLISASWEPLGLRGLAWGGLVFLGGLALFFGIRPVSMWASPFFLAAGLWALSDGRISSKSPVLVKGSVGMGVLGLLAVVVVYGLAPWYKSTPEKPNYPASQIALQAEQRWKEHTNGAAFSYVIGTEWIGGLTSIYAPSRPTLFIRANPKRSPLVTDQIISSQGALVIWEKSRRAHDGKNPSLSSRYPELAPRFPSLVELEDLVVAWPRWNEGLQGRFGLALIPPDPTTAP